jgi:hypothetical protein
MSDDSETPKMFHQRLEEKFRCTMEEALAEELEVLRSVCVVFDYAEPLNDADGITKVIWLGPNGQVTAPSSIIGSAGNTLTAAAFMLDRAFTVLESVKKETEKTFQEYRDLLEKQEKLLNKNDS